MKRLSYLIQVFALIFAGACSVIAQERQFPDYNCAITPPADWHELTNLPPQQGRCAVFGNAPKTRIVLIIFNDKTKPLRPVDDRFPADFERMAETSGLGKLLGEKVSGKFIQVGGIKSYERLGRGFINGTNASTIIQLIPVNGGIYELNGIQFGDDTHEDPEIREALASFRFITPPSTPALSAAYRIGYMIGYAAPCVVSGVMAAAVLAFLFRRSRSANQQTSSPPPPPIIRQ